MFSFLREIIICPDCAGELKWNVAREEERRIMEAAAHCTGCGRAYSVQNGIGRFGGGEDGWESQQNFLFAYLEEHPDKKAALMAAQPEELNAADLSVRAFVEQAKGDARETGRLFAMMREKAYKPHIVRAGDAQANYVAEALKDEKGTVLDIASGNGKLVQEMLRRSGLYVISSDISPHVLENARRQAEAGGYASRVSYIAFDANHIPFRDRSLAYITTYMGMQNIPNAAGIFGELRRICKGRFDSACVFCPQDNAANLSALERNGLDATWVRQKYIDALCGAGFTVSVENAMIVPDEPTPKGQIVPVAEIDLFPVAAGLFEYATVRCRA